MALSLYLTFLPLSQFFNVQTRDLIWNAARGKKGVRPLWQSIYSPARNCPVCRENGLFLRKVLGSSRRGSGQAAAKAIKKNNRRVREEPSGSPSNILSSYSQADQKCGRTCICSSLYIHSTSFCFSFPQFVGNPFCSCSSTCGMSACTLWFINLYHSSWTKANNVVPQR